MLEQLVQCLRCPHCGDDLRLEERTLQCAAGHAFDLARQGYANLLHGDAQPGTADSAAMVEARERFLAHEHYLPLAQALAAEVERAFDATDGGCLVDLGGGTGYHLAAALDRVPAAAGLTLDISKHAARRAARAHPRGTAVVCDVWAPLPVRDEAAAVVLDVFAPRNGPEIARLLAPRGTLVVATPSERHLEELREPLGLLDVDARKQERLERTLGPLLEQRTCQPLEWRMSLAREDVRALVEMGPSARHVDRVELERALETLPDPVEATASVTISTYGSSSPA